MSETTIAKETIYPKGAPVTVDAVRVNNQTYLISGRFVKTASLKHEWQEDVANPGEVIAALQRSPIQIDLLKFWQRIPDTDAKYSYYKEWQPVAAIPITTHKHWWDKQIRFRARNKIRKAEKLGVLIQEVELDDHFVHGVMGIYNQSPVRRGKPFRHYGKDFATVKAELAIDINEAILVGAYFNEELIGFVKLQIHDRYARLTLILDKIAHRDKSPTNAMVSKVVEVCAQRKVPFVTYNLWRRGDHGKFQESLGFEKIYVPEYCIPLTWAGQFVQHLRLHRGLLGILPDSLVSASLAIRSQLYANWYNVSAGFPPINRKISPRQARSKPTNDVLATAGPAPKSAETQNIS